MAVTIPRVDPKPVGESRALLSHLMGPGDANASGNIHGGTIMKLTDEAAGLAAVGDLLSRVARRPREATAGLRAHALTRPDARGLTCAVCRSTL